MGASWYRTRAELRQRRGATVLLILLVGLVGGIVMTTAAGARRSATAYERFREETLAGDLDIAPSEPSEADFEAIRALPEVAAMTRTSFPFIVPKGAGLYPFLDFLAMAAMDEEFARTIDRLRMLSGRIPPPSSVHEALVTETYAAEADLTVGDEITFESYAPDQFESLFTTGDAGPPGGPEVTLTVAGVVRVPDLLSESVGSFSPRVVLSPAFLEEYGAGMAVYPGGARVRLHGGAADIPAVVAAVRAQFPGDAELEIAYASELGSRIQASIDVLVVGLLICALLAAGAGVVVLGQALARHLWQVAAEDRTHTALGMSRRDRAASLVLASLPIALGGSVLAGAAAVAASPLMPLGVARRAEPDRGLSVDGMVIGAGAVAVFVMVMGSVALSAWMATGRRAAAAVPSRSGRSHVAGRVAAQVGLRPPAVLGVGMALDRGERGPTSTPARSTLAAVVTGVGGVVAVTVFAASMGALLESPPRFGYPWHALVAGFQGGLLEEEGDRLSNDPDVAALASLTTSLARLGQSDVNIHAFVTLKGDADPTLLEGRLPAAPDEVALGTRTMRDAGVGIGDTVVMEGPERVELRVVGQLAFPIIDDRSALDRGAALTPAGLEPLASQQSLNEDVLITWAEGVDVDLANEALAASTGAEVSGVREPSEVNNLRLIRSMPVAMVVVLALFAALAATHALAATVRRRRQEMAVLRSLGFVRRQLNLTMAVQATALATVGLLIGAPLGVVGGRLAWRSVAGGIGVIDRPEAPVLALAAIAVSTVVVLNLAALRPSSQARRIPPATVFRSG